MKILVTGGAGFIGSHFIRYILAEYPEAVVLNYDALTYCGNLDNVRDVERNPRYLFVKGDIAERSHLSEVFKNFQPDYVINFAAETHVDKSIYNDAFRFVNSNILGVLNFLEIMKKGQPVRKFVQVSTDEVYGSIELESDYKFNEKSPFLPNSPYAASKVGGDSLCRAYNQTFGLPIVVTHSSNNYGPNQYPEKIIPFFILRLLEGKTLPLYGDGKNVRDWIYVLDNCSALALCLFKGKAGEVYNIGSDNDIANLDIAKLILKRFNKEESLIEFVADRPGHDRRYAVDSSKIKRELGWAPKYSFKESFEETIDWYVDNKEWIRNVLEKRKNFKDHIEYK